VLWSHLYGVFEKKNIIWNFVLSIQWSYWGAHNHLGRQYNLPIFFMLRASAKMNWRATVFQDPSSICFKVTSFSSTNTQLRTVTSQSNFPDKDVHLNKIYGLSASPVTGSGVTVMLCKRAENWLESLWTLAGNHVALVFLFPLLPHALTFLFLCAWFGVGFSIHMPLHSRDLVVGRLSRWCCACSSNGAPP
jgi:hypothetical protein